MAASDVEVVLRGLDAFTHGGVEALVALCSEDVEMRSAIVGGAEANVYRGHDGIRQWSRERDEAFEGIELTHHESHVIGGRVVALGHLHARGVASGVELDSEIGWVVVVRDGLIRELHGYLDKEAALEAARAAPPEGDSAAEADFSPGK